MMNKPHLKELTAYDRTTHHAIQRLMDQLTPSPVMLNEELLRALIADPSSHLYLLEEEGSIVGMLTLGIYLSPTGSKAWIEDVVVDSEARGRGYGKRLVEHAIAEARRAGVEQLMLTSNPLRVAANHLYQQMGFQRKETNCYRMDMGK